MAVDLPIRAHLDDKGIEELIAALNKVGRAAGMSEKELEELNAQARKSGKEGAQGVNEYNKSLNNLVTGGLKRAAAAAAGFVAAAKIGQLGKQIFDLTAQYQKMSAVLTNALGSRSAAQQSLRMLEQFAAKTPFQVDKLTASYVKLVNQGFKPTEQELRKLGDLSASTGKDFDQLTEAIIDAQTGEFERLKEFGIRAQKEGDNVTFTFKGVQTQVDFTNDSIRDYILSLGDLTGVSGSMAAISETVGGKLSNMRDTVDQILTGLGNHSSGLIGGFLDLVNDALAPLNEALNNQVTALQKEQNELNGLVGAITDVNVPTEVRAKLIEDLNRKYPDFLRNMDVEKVTNEELVLRLKDVNEQFQRKILLVAAEKELAKTSERIIELVNVEAEARLRLEKIKRGEFTPQASAGGGPDFTTNEQKLAAARAAAEETINLALEERTQLTQENVEKLQRYQEALGLFNETNNDYFETENEITKGEKTRKDVVKGLIAQLEQRIKLLQQQKKEAETPQEIRRLKIEIDGLSKSLERLNKLGAGATPVIAQITSEGLKIKEVLEEGSKRAVDRFEDEMERFTKVLDDNLDDTKDREARRRDIMLESFNFISTLLSGVASIQAANHEAEIAALEQEKEYELKLAGDNARAKENINKKFAAEEKRLKSEQAQREKQSQLFHIAVNTAAAVAKTLAQFGMPLAIPFIAMAVAEGAIQTAIVQAAKVPRFAKGQYRVQGPGTPTSDSIPALISRDESVVPANRNSRFGFALKPIIENDNFTIKDLKDQVDAHVPMQLRGDLFYPTERESRTQRLEEKLDKVIRAIEGKKEFQLGIDEDGFKKWVKSGHQWTEYLDKRYRFE